MGARSRPAARGGPIGVNGSPWEREAGQPQQASRSRPPAAGQPQQATRKGWPYYIRPLPQWHEPPVYGRASRSGPATAGQPQQASRSRPATAGQPQQASHSRPAAAGQPQQASHIRPPARGGPTIYAPSPSGTSRPCIVGPPLAGDPPGVALLSTPPPPVARMHRI